jgi:hypothetical protein
MKIWEVESGSIEWLKEEGWEQKLRLTSTEEQVIESMNTVLLLGRSGTGKTICIANKMQADRRVAPGTSQLFVTRSLRVCHFGAGDSCNMHFFTLHEVIHCWDNGNFVLAIHSALGRASEHQIHESLRLSSV